MISFDDFASKLDPNGQEPLDLQIARLLAAVVMQGRLKPGAPLPGTRQLAEQLGVARYSVMGAFRELEAEGWVEIRPGSGTFVAEKVPPSSFMRWQPKTESLPERAQEPGYDLPSNLLPITEQVQLLFDLSSDKPDPRLAPKDALGMSYRRAIQRHGDSLLDQGEPQGNRILRQGIADWLSTTRSLIVDPEQILITRGNRMATDLVVSSLIKKGGSIVVNHLGNRATWDAMQRTSGVVLKSLPQSPQGLDIRALSKLLETETIRLIHIQPIHQFPTGVSLDEETRRNLLALAQEHRVAILEEDRDSYYHYEGPPPLPLAAADTSGQVILMGSLSGLLASGIRLGFLVAPKSLIERLTRVRVRMDSQGDRVLEWAVGDLVRSGDVERHLRRTRKIYQERMDHFYQLMETHLTNCLKFSKPEGGLGFWVEANHGFDLDAWVLRCRERGVRIQSSSYYRIDETQGKGTRLGFVHIEIEQQGDLIQRLLPIRAK